MPLMLITQARLHAIGIHITEVLKPGIPREQKTLSRLPMSDEITGLKEKKI